MKYKPCGGELTWQLFILYYGLGELCGFLSIHSIPSKLGIKVLLDGVERDAQDDEAAKKII